MWIPALLLSVAPPSSTVLGDWVCSRLIWAGVGCEADAGRTGLEEGGCASLPVPCFPTTLSGEVVPSPFYQESRFDSGRVGDLSKVTQLVLKFAPNAWLPNPSGLQWTLGALRAPARLGSLTAPTRRAR